MIASLRGKLIEVNPPQIVIEVNGVGYLCQASMTTIYQLPPAEADVFLHTHQVVREDAHLLFAFAEKQERKCFCELIKINGVGPKVALAILSNISVVDLALWVAQEEVGRFKKIPGVGPKMAQRIVLDFKDKAKQFLGVGELSAEPQNRYSDEAFDALLALGYKGKEAQLALDKITKDDYGSSQDMIKAALKGLAKA